MPRRPSRAAGTRTASGPQRRRAGRSGAGRRCPRCRRCRRSRASRRRRRRRCLRSSTAGWPALAAGILVVMLVLVLLARGCSGSSAKSANENYVSELTDDRCSSRRTPSRRASTRRSTCAAREPRPAEGGASTRSSPRMRRCGRRPAALKPTKQLAPYQSALLQALQLRVTGLQLLLAERLADGVEAAASRSRPAQQLYQCIGQLLSSDYVYADFFANGANAALKQARRRRRADVAVPGARPTSTWSRRRHRPGAAAAAPGCRCKGLHGTQVGIGRRLAAGPHPAAAARRTRSSATATSCSSSSVKNSGNFTEVGVNVQLKLKRVERRAASRS